MKKFLFGLALAWMSVSSVHAIDWKISREENGYVRYLLNDVAASTSTILIDLSDITNFPHDQTGYISINAIRVTIDKVAAATGTVSIGVVTAISATNGDVEYFYDNRFDRDTVGTHLADYVNYEPGCIRAYVNSSGATPFFTVTTSTAASQVYQNDVGLTTSYQPAGKVNPAVGDIVARFETAGSNTNDIVFEVWYHSRRP